MACFRESNHHPKLNRAAQLRQLKLNANSTKKSTRLLKKSRVSKKKSPNNAQVDYQSVNNSFSVEEKNEAAMLLKSLELNPPNKNDKPAVTNEENSFLTASQIDFKFRDVHTAVVQVLQQNDVSQVVARTRHQVSNTNIAHPRQHRIMVFSKRKKHFDKFIGTRNMCTVSCIFDLLLFVW